ncbi:hypothetical protein [Streptomyces sp. NPDC048277]|uniref:hypothetical protein n=1 Tax=Streptomyces sp. NPDC048277 TaxID=3155027 RepID=UPI0033E914EB
MRIVRGTRRGGSLDMPLTVGMGIAMVVALTGAGSMSMSLDLAVPLAGGGVPMAVAVPLAGALIGRPPVPGRCFGLPGPRPGVWRRSPG